MVSKLECDSSSEQFRLVITLFCPPRGDLLQLNLGLARRHFGRHRQAVRVADRILPGRIFNGLPVLEVIHWLVVKRHVHFFLRLLQRVQTPPEPHRRHPTSFSHKRRIGKGEVVRDALYLSLFLSFLFQISLFFSIFLNFDVSRPLINTAQVSAVTVHSAEVHRYP